MPVGKIRVGVVGANVRAGWGGRAHLPAILGLPEYELRAVCTAHPETAQESARHFGAPLAFHDYAQMAQHPEIDLVSVAVRAPLHHAVVMAALEAGKHVFCEWPLGANTAEAQEMASLAQRTGVRTMVGLQARAAPPLVYLKELVEEGYLGQVIAVHMTMLLPGGARRRASGAWAADRRTGTGALAISGGHALDALCFCLGEFQEVSALVTTQVKQWHLTDTQETIPVTTPDNVLVNGMLQGGAVVSVHVGSVPWHGSGWRLEVFGTEGSLLATSSQMFQLADAIELWGAKGTSRNLEKLTIPERFTWVPETVPAGPAFNVAQMFRRLAEAIQQSREIEANFATALRRHRLLDLLDRSSDVGRRLSSEEP